MKISIYDIDLEKAVEHINKKKIKKVGVQIPEGLKIHLFKIIDFLKNNTEAEYIISGDPCYGACDLVDDNISVFGAELLIHIGHIEIPALKNTKIPVIFLNALAEIDISEVIEKAIPSIQSKKIGITTTAQHKNIIDDVCIILKDHGFEPIIGKGDRRIDFPGQILGCNFTSATSIKEKVDMYLYIGSGNFHPLGMIISTKKDVIICDPYTNKVTFKELVDFKDMVLKQRYGAIARAKDARKFGIIISFKTGQNRIEEALRIKKMLDDKKKDSYLIAVDFLSPANLESFREIDCFVSTACPRVAIDDYMQYKTPIITPIELEVLLNYRKWDDYCFDEIYND